MADETGNAGAGDDAGNRIRVINLKPGWGYRTRKRADGGTELIILPPELMAGDPSCATSPQVRPVEPGNP